MDILHKISVEVVNTCDTWFKHILYHSQRTTLRLYQLLLLLLVAREIQKIVREKSGKRRTFCEGQRLDTLKDIKTEILTFPVESCQYLQCANDIMAATGLIQVHSPRRKGHRIDVVAVIKRTGVYHAAPNAYFSTKKLIQNNTI